MSGDRAGAGYFGVFEAEFERLFQFCIEAVQDSCAAGFHGALVERFDGARRIWTHKRLALVTYTCKASVIHADGLNDAQMGQRYGFAGAGAAKDIATISAMMLAVQHGEWCPAPHAQVRVCPFGRGAAIKHALGDLDSWWEFESFSLQVSICASDDGEVVSALCKD